MIEKIITELGPWSWWVFGFSLLIVEIIAPGIFFLWIGLAAIIVGTAALLVDIAWQVQMVAFAILSLLLAVLGRHIYARFGKKEGPDLINARGLGFVGQTYLLEDAMEGGNGRIRIGDTFWLVHGPDHLPAGSKITVTGQKGTVLIVQASDDN